MAESVFQTLVSGPELASRLGVSIKTIERWVRQRLIPSYRLGRKCTRYDVTAVLAALEKFQRPALKRLPQRIYSPRKRSPKARYEAQQLELRFGADPNQLALGLAFPEVEEGS